MSLKYYLVKCKQVNLVALFWIVINSLCLLFNGLLSGKALNALVKLDVKEFIVMALLTLLTNVIWAIQIYKGSATQERAIQTMNTEIRKDIAMRIENAGYGNYHQQQDGIYASWLTNDINTIEYNGFQTLAMMITQALNIIVSIITLLTYNLTLMITVTVFVILMYLLPKLFQKRINDSSLDVTHKNEDLVAKINDVLAGFNTLNNYNRLDLLVSKITDRSDKVTQSKVNYAKQFGAMMAVSNGMSFISQIAILIHAGILFALKLVPIGVVTTSQYFGSIIFSGLTGFMANWSEVKTVQPIFHKFESLGADNTYDGGALQSLQDTIQVKDLSFAYSDGKPIFDKLSLAFKARHKYAIIADSGRGKSTLLNLLAGNERHYDGTISYDSINYNQISSEQLNAQIAYVQQKPHIFDETLRFNLTLGRDISNEEIKDALSFVNLEHLFELLDGQVSESLSGGESQRVAIARALLAQKQVFLLDEATSAVDKESSKSIEKKLLSNPDYTVVIVSHHFDNDILGLIDTTYHL